MKKLGILGVAVLAAFGLGGCSKQQDVATAIAVYQQVVALALDDLPALQAAGILTPSDVTAATNWLNGATALGTQATTCVNASGGTSSVIVGCVTAIGTGLESASEQADLRIISPGAQKKVTLYVTAVVFAANGIQAVVNIVKTAVPPVGSTAAPAAPASTEDLQDFQHRLPAPTQRLIQAFGY
jgi:hypothetical protein